MIFYMKGCTIYLLYCQTTQGFQADVMVVVVGGGGGEFAYRVLCSNMAIYRYSDNRYSTADVDR